MKRFTFGLTAVLLALSLGSIAQTNVFDDIIVQSPNHTYLEAALLQEGLESELRLVGSESIATHDQTSGLARPRPESGVSEQHAHLGTF